MNKFIIYIFLLLVIFSCKKESQVIINYNKRSVDKNGGVICFYENDIVNPENLIVKLDFKKNIVNNLTVVNLFRLKKDDFPYFTNYAFYPLTDIISFSPNDITFNGEVEVEIPYQKIIYLDNAWNDLGASNNLLYNKQHLFKLYKIPNDYSPLDSVFDINKWTEVQNFEIDSINSIVKFRTDNFNNKYIFAFPESKRQDVVVCNVVNDIYNFGYYFSFSYLNSKYPYNYDMGFVHIDNCSHYNIQASKVLRNNAVADIYMDLSVKHNGVGTFSGSDVKLLLKETNIENDGILYGRYAENLSNLIVEISEFGDVGQKIKGKITGTMKNTYGNEQFNIEIFFEAIRTR